MRLSEAKLIIKLKNMDSRLRNPGDLALSLEVDYSYVARLLREMSKKGWLRRVTRGRNSFYELTEVAPFSQAVQRVTNG